MRTYAKTKKTTATPKFDIKKKVTSLILEACEQEEKLPWDKGVLNSDFFPINPQTGNIYKGFNRLFLYWLGAKGNDTLEFITKLGATKMGGKVNEKAQDFQVVYWNFSKYNVKEKRKPQEGDDPKDIKVRPFMRYFTVYKITETTVKPTRKFKERDNASIEDIDAFITKFAEASGVKIDYKKSGTACYRPRKHEVSIAGRTYYKSSEEFYSTIFHELVHSTAKEMARKVEFGLWGDHTYSKEEVVAETGAMFLCHYFGINKTTERNSQAYLQSWSKKLRENPLWLISGANAAEKAVNYMLTTAGLTPMSDSTGNEPEPEEIGEATD